MKIFKKYINEAEKYDNLSEEEQLELVKKNPYNIKYITNPSVKVQLEAVKLDGLYIYYIENPSKQMQLEAVKQNIYSIFNIKNPHQDITFYCIIKKPELLKIKKYYDDQKLPINYFRNLDYEIQKRLVDYDSGFALLIPNLDKKLRSSLNTIRDIAGLI